MAIPRGECTPYLGWHGAVPYAGEVTDPATLLDEGASVASLGRLDAYPVKLIAAWSA